MLSLQDQSGRPKTVLQEPCAVSHDEETLYVSTTACVGQNISTQESMLHSDLTAVPETETPITTLVENHQTDSSAVAGPASTILSTMSSIKLRDIMEKMTSCLFGWSWRQVSLFDLTGKNTDADQPTVCIPCTDIVPVAVQELFFPCSLLEDTMSCNQEVEELMAIPPPPSLAELELCLRLAGIYDITACLSVVFRPECIVEVDCSVENFEAIADRMTVIGLPLPIRSPASTLAIVPPQSSTVQEDQTAECDNQEMVLSLLEDTTGYNQVQVIQPSTAELELRLQLPGVGDVTDSLRVVFRPECMVQVDCSMTNFEAIADHMRDIGLRLPTRSTDSTLAIMPPQSLIVEEVLTSEIQPVDCGNYDMALVVPQGAMQSINQEAVEHPSLPALTAVEETETVNIDEICSLFASMSGHNTKQPPMKSASKVLKGSEIFFGKTVDPRARDEENYVQDPVQGNIASSPNEVQAIEPLLVQSQPRTAELELRLQLPGVCDITGRLRVVFRPECIVQVDLSILRFEVLGDYIREIDLQLPMDAIANSLVAVSSQPITVQEVTTSEVQPAEHSSIPALPAKAKAKAKAEAEAIDIKDFYSLLASMSGHAKVPSASDVDDSKESERFFGEAVQRVKHNDVQGEITIRNNEVQVIESLVVRSQPDTVELELRLQLPEVCNITGRLRVVFRPECIVQVDLSILRFEALGDDIREIDLQLPMDAIVNALATLSSQPITVQKVTTSEAQPVEHSSIPALPPKAKAKAKAKSEGEAINIKEFYSLLASLSCHAEESSHDFAELKGSPILCELKIAPTDEEIEHIVAIEPAEGLKPLDIANNLENANNLDKAAWKETTVTAQSDLEVKEPVKAVPITPTEKIELQHPMSLGLQEVSVEKQPTLEQTVSESTVSSPSAQEVQASGSVTTLCQAIKTEDVHPTSNVLEEVVAREIREIRETVDNSVGGIRDVPLERPTVIRRRKRSHADDSDDNQLSKDCEVEERVAKDLVLEGIQESPFVTNGAQRYPSDVYQALLTQTVHLLERGIILLSDDGSFIAVANPSAASRIGDAITRHTFAQNFHRYDNDVLPPDLKQKVIERAAVVAREHQDRVLEGMVERPIFTLSEIRHYDCNGDYIMEDVSSPNPPVYPTGIQTTPVHQGFVNPFLTGMTPQGLLTADMHTSFQLLQHEQYINDIEMIDVEELYMDVDESIDDMFMECEDQEDCPYCSQISLSLFASLPTKYPIRRRAIYSLLDKRPLNPEIPSWKTNEVTKKSWFAYNTFSFRPEFDQSLGGLSCKDRVMYSLLDERPLNPVLAPSLAKQSKSKSWIAYNTFSFKEGDLVPVGSNCDCMQTMTAVEPWPEPEQVANPVFSATSEENMDTAKSPFNTFSFRPQNHSSQQASIFEGSKQESVFSFGKTEPPVLPTEPETVSSGISWKDFSFREEDDPQTEAEKSCENDQQSPDLPCKPETQPVTKTSSGISWKDFSFREDDGPLFQAEADKSYETKEQPIDFSFETEKQSVNKETLASSCEKGEEPTFPVSEDSDTTSSETERHDDDSFDLNDENEEQTMKEIIAAVKSKLDKNRMYYRPQEDVAQVLSKGESGKVDETASKVEPVNKQGVADGQTNLEATDNEDKAQKDGRGQSQETNQVSKDPPEAAKQEKCSSLESREPASKLTISHSKSINKRSEPYPTQAVSGLAAFMRRRVKMVERDRLRTLQVLTQVTLEDKDADPSEPVPALPADNAQQRKDVSLKSLTGNTQTRSSSKPDLTITIGPSEAEKRKVVSLKSTTGNQQTRSSSKPDLTITIGASDDEERQVVSSRTMVQDNKADLPTAPSVQSDVNNSNKKISLKSLTQTKKKEADAKGSEMDRLKSRHQSKDADVLSKSTPTTTSAVSAAQWVESSTKHDAVKGVKHSKTVDLPKESIPSKPLPAVKVEESRMVSLKSLTRGSKSEPMNNAAVASPPASTATGSRTEVSFKTTDAKGKERESNNISSSKTKVSDEKNPQVVVMDKVTVASDVAETGSARKFTFGMNQERPMEDALIKISPSEQKPKMVSSRKESHATTVAESSSVKAVDFNAMSIKKDKVIKLSKKTGPCEQTLKKESHASSVVGPCSAKTVDMRSKLSKNDKLKITSTEVASCEANKVSSLKKESQASAVEGPDSAKTVDLRSMLKKDDLKMLSTETASCEANNVSSLKKEAQAATVQEPGSAKTVDLGSILKKDNLKMLSTEPGSCEKNSKEASLKKAPNASSGPENGSAKEVESTSSAPQKKDLTKTSPSTKPVSCKRNVNVVSFKSVSPTSSVQTDASTKEAELTSTASQKADLTKTSPTTKPVSHKRSVNLVPLKSVSQSEKDGSLCKPSSSKSPSSCDEQENQLMSFKSVTKREWAVPVRKSSGPVNTSVLPMEACAVTPTADVKIDASAKVDDQPDPVVTQPSSSEKRKTFESLTSSHKRELDEMLEEDQQSDKERLRNFTSRAGQKYSRKTTRKENVQPKPAGNYNSGDGERKNSSEADKVVKLVKTDVVQDTSVAKGIPVTKKELQPISLTVDVNKVKDAENESTQQWVPGTLKETKPSTERRAAVTDVTNSNTTQSRQGTSQQSSLTSLAAVGTDSVGECGGSAVQSSQAIPDPRPLPPAEAAEGIVAHTMNTVNILQSSPSTVPTTTEPSSVNNTETVSEEATNMAVSVETKDTSETPCLRDPQQSASMDLVKEPLCLAGVVAISGENQTNLVKIPEPVPQPAAENVTPAGKRKLHDMQQEEDEKIPSLAEVKPVERRKKRRWRTEEKIPEKQEQPNKPRRRIVRNMFKKG